MGRGPKDRWNSTCTHSVKLYRSDTWPVTEEDVTGKERCKDDEMDEQCQA